ncbi:hypothetical protein I4U23_018004 [Adineta vaga]|nr:hypothetical protein I4U23_018004 [Adineta vaga]
MKELSIDEQEEEKAMEQTSLLSTVNQDELRKLCFLLNEEHQKLSALVEQWKVFSMNVVDKLTSQIITYQEKLTEVEQRQISFLKENDSLRLIIKQIRENQKQNEQSQRDFEKCQSSFHSFLQRSKPIYDHLLRTKVIIEPEISLKQSFDDLLQQQISIENIFDAIKTIEIYESIQSMTHQSEKTLLKHFCNFVWKYLENGSKSKSS